MLSKVSLTRLEKRSCLFLDKDEVAIVVSGQMYLFLHSEDVACPQLSSILNPGDIIGFKEIDNGLSCDEHAWICTPHPTDIFKMSKEYMKYLWHKMKMYDNSAIVDILQKNPSFQKMSEQTLFKISQDLIHIREFKSGDKISPQDKRSVFNLQKIHEHRNLKNFCTPTKKFMGDLREFESYANPKLSKQWEHVDK
jgi:CRP-like cAMP-binding protein